MLEEKKFENIDVPIVTPLGIAQVRVALDEGPRCVEESGYFLVSHLFVNLPADLRLTLVMKSPYSPAT